MNPLGYPVIDSDTHWYEPDDCFTRHIDPKFRDVAVHTVPSDEPGVGRWVVGDHGFKHLRRNLSDKMHVPGAISGLFTGEAEMTDRNVAATYRPKDRPEIMQRIARETLMDEHGVRAQIMLPSSTGLAIEKELQDRPDVLCANTRAFNRWVEDDWGFGADGRIFGVPTLTLYDVDWAVQEVESLAGRGAKMFHLPTGPVGKRSPADPHFDRFWATVQETGLIPIFHVGFSELHEIYGQYWSEDTSAWLMEWSPMQMYLSEIERPICDTLAALTLHNLFGRFPKLQVMTVELGSDWLIPLTKVLDKAVRFGGGGKKLVGGPVAGLPSEILRNHLRISPYPEDDLSTLVPFLGPERVLFGSDFPHPEGLAEPLSYLKYLEGFPEPTVRSIMHDNAAGVLGLSPAPVG